MEHIDHTDHDNMLAGLKESFDLDHENRERVREARLFVSKRDGQWQPELIKAFDDAPRYTFDMTSPQIDQVAGALEKADFVIDIEPAGAGSTKETAEAYDGLIRNIQNISRANAVYNSASREMVTSGFDGWRVVQKFIDGDTFDQDLAIERVGNWIDRVWFGPHEEPDASDADRGWILTGITKPQYKDRYPDGSMQSVSIERSSTAYCSHPEQILVGEYLYVKEISRELVMMSDGSVYERDDDFNRIIDELAQRQEPVFIALDKDGNERTRVRKKRTVWSRRFDNGGWLSTAKPTVFSWIPLIPLYGNFKIIEQKVIYYGVVEKLYDYQRGYNTSKSREIAEGSLAPRGKYWGTEKQVLGHTKSLATLNTNSEPLQIYNSDPDSPGPPLWQNGGTINPGLITLSQSMAEGMRESSGKFAASMGDNPNAQSGVAIEALQARGDIGTIKYFQARETAQCHTAKILLAAIPKVYQPGRQIRLLKDDGVSKTVTVGEQVQDRQTGQITTLNDLSVGVYDVSCTSGPSFKSRQSETVSGLIEIAQVQPEVLQLGADILLDNISAPGLAQVAERMRAQLFNAGAIPVSQWSEEEQQEVARQQQAAQNQPPQEDPNLLIGQAELIRAKNEEAKTQVDIAVKTGQQQLAEQREQREAFNANARARTEAMKLQGAVQNDEFRRMMDAMRQQQDAQAAQVNNLKTMTQALVELTKAYGVETIASPGSVRTLQSQIAIIDSEQSGIQ